MNMVSNSPSRASTDPLLHVQKTWSTTLPNSPIYQFLLSEATLLSASCNPASVTARLTVKAVHLNSKGTLHGSVSTCLIDWAGGLAIAASGRERTGVSTDLHASFVGTAREGDVLEVVAGASKVGGTLAFTTVEISTVSVGDGGNGEKKVVCVGSHTKYVK